MNLPYSIKKFIVLFISLNWKWFYYAPNTYKVYCMDNLDKEEYNKLSKKQKTKKPYYLTTYLLYSKNWLKGLSYVLLPYFIYTFIILPGLWLFISYMINLPSLYSNALINVALSEIFTK